MRCFSPAEAEAIFGPLGFTVSLEHSWYRLGLVLDDAHAAGQIRVGAQQPRDIGCVAHFARTLNRWLPSDHERLLWFDHLETGAYGFEDALVTAARIGLGETRSLEEAPGYYFDKQNWDEEDQLNITIDHAREMGLLVGLLSTMMFTGSDGWLISTGCSDRIEFWEGNFFFYSREEKQISRANSIINDFGCVRDLV